ncbi:hypothetical protein Nocox_00215 [Nonomuraea coxensis DSM 45129]|uniref:Glyoxalase/bleomycin resistance protein/dioxygenase n=1 Tax=Nonomuraea coxensis DSM 45129 TaxID=1122611 RepID=A0ABX8TQU7_9ACTN|nr:hypothetical protein Nocox_00215 [Nonomuraea coxensis DSM 45129]
MVSLLRRPNSGGALPWTCTAHGIEHEPVETYSNGVRHVEILDPDGNSMSLAQGPQGTP